MIYFGFIKTLKRRAWPSCSQDTLREVAAASVSVPVPEKVRNPC
jgi:hypothetical protein